MDCWGLWDGTTLQDGKPVLVRTVDMLQPGALLQPTAACLAWVQHCLAEHNAGQLYYTVGTGTDSSVVDRIWEQLQEQGKCAV